MSQQCKTQADCFRELARVMDMCEGTNVKWYDAIQCDDSNWWKICAPNFESPKHWIFAIAIVEDRPVFIGDTLYDAFGSAVIITGVSNLPRNCYFSIQGLSWNPLKKEPEIPEGYTRHDGGECPVHPNTVVDVVFRNKLIEQNAAAKSYRWDFMNGWDIIAYKVVKPATVMVGLALNVSQSGAKNVVGERGSGTMVNFKAYLANTVIQG